MQLDDKDLENINLGLSAKPDLSMSDSDKPQDTVNRPKKKKKKSAKKPPKAPRKKWSKKKKIIVWSIVVVLLIGAGVGGFFLYKYLTRSQENSEQTSEPTVKVIKHYYSTLSGEEISSPDLNSSPTYCAQIPNGLDGARPQAGLEQAPVVFEAIAEAGITRFAAIFQNPTASAIGPIRSLRQYYLEWDVPFDCTIVHAGGSDEALNSLAVGGFRDLTEDYTYMWRDYSAYLAPNNLFTSSDLMKQFNSDHGYSTSEVKSFARLRPNAAKQAYEEAIEASKDKTETNAAGDEITVPGTPLVTNISVNFGYTVSYNTAYAYDPENNVYYRSYADGVPHMTYTCPEGLTQPRPQHDCGEPTQVAPKAVAVMVVDQTLASDAYHLNTETVGSGKAYVFQNGTAVEGTWSRQSATDVIKFTSASGEDISFTPGQLWLAAIPATTGSVYY